jgi:predicted transcriptional regulator
VCKAPQFDSVVQTLDTFGVLRKLLLGRLAGSPPDPIETAFGILERDVMRVLWEGSDLAVRDVQTRLSRGVAYTTVMTTLDRLFKKGVLTRRQTGRAFLYSAALTRAQLQAQIAGGVLSGLLQGRDGATAPLLSNFVESVSEQDGGAELLRELEDLVKQKRRQLAKDQKR